MDYTFDYIFEEYLKHDADSLNKILSAANELLKVLCVGGIPIEAKELDYAVDGEDKVKIEFQNDLGLEL